MLETFVLLLFQNCEKKVSAALQKIEMTQFMGKKTKHGIVNYGSYYALHIQKCSTTCKYMASPMSYCTFLLFLWWHNVTPFVKMSSSELVYALSHHSYPSGKCISEINICISSTQHFTQINPEYSYQIKLDHCTLSQVEHIEEHFRQLSVGKFD
jgi:hypothetical protein